MKIKNDYGLIQIFLTYFILYIPWLISNITDKFNIDLFMLCFMVSILVMVDAKMKHNNLLVNISFYIIVILFIIFFISLYLR